MRILLIIFLFIGFVPEMVQSIESDIRFQHFSLGDGMPNNTIYEMVQSEDGFLYMTTQQGVLRFDGVKFQQFMSQTEDGHYHSDLTDNIFEDENGRLWVGYQDNFKIAYYDRESGVFQFIDLQEILDIEGGIRHTRLKGIDKRGRLWVSVNHQINPRQSWIITIDTNTTELLDVFVDEENKSLFGDAFFMRIALAYTGINQFYATDDGVWISAVDALFFIDYEENTIHTYTEHPVEDQSMAASAFLEVDEQLWISTASGLFVFDENEDRFDSISGQPEELRNADLRKLYMDDQNTVWISGRSGIFKYQDGEFFNVANHTDLSHFSMLVLLPMIETDTHIWFIRIDTESGATSETNGIMIYDKTADSFTEVRHDPGDPESLVNNRHISQILRDDTGGIWVGYYLGGLSYYHPDQIKFPNLFHDQNIAAKLGEWGPMEVAEDSRGRIWTGTTNGLVLVTDMETLHTELWHEFEQLGPVTGTDRNFLTGFYFEDEETVWVGTEWSGLQRFKYDPESLEIRDITIWIPSSGKDNYLISLPSNFLEGRDNNLWISSSRGFAEFRFDTGLFESHEYDSGGVYDPYYNFGRRGLIDTKGRIWFYGDGVKSYKPDTGEIIRHNHSRDFPDAIHLDDLATLALVEDPSGNIIVTGIKGLMKLNEETQVFEPYLENFQLNVTDIITKEDGSFVVASYDRGVFFLHPESGVYKQITMEEGLANGMVRSIHYDDSGMLWIMHTLGISTYNEETGIIRNYDRSYGRALGSSDVAYLMEKTTSGYLSPLWIANSHTVFHPDSIAVNTMTRPAFITAVGTGDRELPVRPSESVRLPHDFTGLQISFSSGMLMNASDNRFRYRLTGTGQEWSAWSAERTFQIATLSPGRYQLELQSKNADGVIDPETTQYAFVITPPWYQSTLAYLIYFIVFITFAWYSAIRYSNYRTKQERLHMQAEQSEKLAKIDKLKTNLMLNISHELRTPLTLLMAPIDLLQRKMVGLSEELLRPLEIARRNGKRLHQLVEQVLDLARLEMDDVSFQVQPVDVNSYSKRMLDFFESLADQNNVKLEFQPLSDSQMLYVDVDKFEKIIINLISNAIKFTPEGGSVTLSLQVVENSVYIVVTDTGSGIPADRLAHIFTRFETSGEQTRDGVKGLGVGLSISKEYALLHKGDIRVESKEGEGSRFTVEIPLGTDHLPEDTIVSHEVTDAESTFDRYIKGDQPSIAEVKKHIPGKNLPLALVIEDNDDMRSFISELLSADYRVETAADGEQGIKQLSVLQPDVVITDIMMPGKDGFEVIQHMRSSSKHLLTPVVVLSARSELEDRVKGFEIGVNAYIAKPFHVNELMARVDNLLDLKEKREEAQKEYNDNGKEVLEAPDEQTLMVNKLVEFVKLHISQPEITVDFLADHVKQSRSQFYRNLKLATGYSPAEFVRELRLREAERIVETDKDIRIGELSHRVGFSSASYFSRLFKKRFGRSPRG